MSACAAPSEPPANDGPARSRTPAARRPAGRAHDAVARALRPTRAWRTARADQLARARVAQQLEPLERVSTRGSRWRCARRVEGAHEASRQRTALWPPKPNEFDIADRRGRRRSPSGRALRARSRGRAPRRAPRAERRRRDPLAQRQHRRDRLDGAGRAEQVADRRLRRADRDLRAPLLAQRHFMRGRLRAVVQRRRGAVRVHVVELVRRSTPRPPARARSPARRRGPRLRRGQVVARPTSTP